MMTKVYPLMDIWPDRYHINTPMTAKLIGVKYKGNL